VSRRTIHRAFHDVMGIGAITFLRNKRLGDVHSALLRDGHVLVRDIAKQHGFLQPGKFTQEYRRLFGERPSETVSRAHRRRSG
jgi:transcriptional regulator GlxA family with amidase domain